MMEVKAIMIWLFVSQQGGVTSQRIEFSAMVDCRLAALAYNGGKDWPHDRAMAFCIEVAQ